MTEYIRRGDLADSVYNFSFRPHVEMEYEGDFDDLECEIRDMQADRDEIVHLPDMSKEINGHAFAETNFQLAWTMVEKENGKYDVNRHFLEDFRSQYMVASASNDLKLSDETDILFDILGSKIRAASSTAGWCIYRVASADDSHVWYWHQPSDGEDLVRITDARAFEIVFGCDGYVTFGYGMGPAWDVVSASVRAKQSVEYEGDGQYADEIETLSFFTFRDVFFPGGIQR